MIYGISQYELWELFFQPSDKHPPIEEQLYLFMKRFHTQPTEFFNLDYKLRMAMYEREMLLIEHENKERAKTQEEIEQLKAKNNNGTKK